MSAYGKVLDLYNLPEEYRHEPKVWLKGGPLKKEENTGDLDTPRDKRRRRSSRHPDSRFIPIREAADISGFHRDSLKNYCRAGQIEYSLDKGRWHVNRASLDEFLERITIRQRRGPGRPGRPRILDGE